MSKRSKAAEKMRAYRARQRQPQVASADFEAAVEKIRRLVRSDTPEDMIRRYVGLSFEFERELAGRNRARVLRDLNDALSTAARELGISPREQRLEGRDEETVSVADAIKSLRNVLRLQRTAWELMKAEIQLVGSKEDPAGETRALYLEEITALREKSPSLFAPDEMIASPSELYDRIAAEAPRLPGEPPPAH